MNLEQQIENYQPTTETVDLVRQTKIVLLVGIAGAGKDTIERALLEGPDFRDIVSHTTRLPRINNGVAEVTGTDYNFIDQAAAEVMIESQSFVEVKFVHGTVYGTSAEQLRYAHDEDRIAITDIDVQGVDEYKALSPDVVAIFILPPDYVTWRERLAKRYETTADFEAEWSKRLASAIRELTHALEVPYYHFVVNDDLEQAIAVVDEIAHKPDTFHRKDDEARLKARDLLEAIRAAN